MTQRIASAEARNVKRSRCGGRYDRKRFGRNIGVATRVGGSTGRT